MVMFMSFLTSCEKSSDNSENTGIKNKTRIVWNDVP
jgi:hypothetical protein